MTRLPYHAADRHTRIRTTRVPGYPGMHSGWDVTYCHPGRAPYRVPGARGARTLGTRVPGYPGTRVDRSKGLLSKTSP
eukprot:535453-Rhodomonas_salina.2